MTTQDIVDQFVMSSLKESLTQALARTNERIKTSKVFSPERTAAYNDRTRFERELKKVNKHLKRLNRA
ncbi:hypothetical protein [Aggregatilinea lenta]|uniref:hypothetical protein n=1 Tax=Aggregatilinea lenta TaxID=913108 RepID=UPI000E5BBA86|nr:hypothetical protein [Aggregatilinea lenta]